MNNRILLLLLLITLSNPSSSQSLEQEKLPITHHSLNDQCFSIYQQSSLTSLPSNCYIFVLSKIIGIYLILSSIFTRVPQIYCIFTNKSVYGLSYFGNNMELLMTALTFAYGIHANLPFSIYGENLFLLIQNGIVLSCFFIFPSAKHHREFHIRQFYLFFTLIICGLFIGQFVPHIWQQISIWLQLIVFFFARFSQILTNIKNKSTGNLSFGTTLITVTGNILRTFTILIESQTEIGYLLNYLIPFFVNGFILHQFYRYNSKPKSQTII